MSLPTGHGPTVATPSGRNRFQFQTFSSLQYRNFRFLWGGTLFASAGNWIQQVTLGWLIYDMTKDAFLVGTLQGMRAVPFLLVGPVAGVIADRMERRKLLLVNQFFLGAIALLFALDIAQGWVEVWHLFVFAFLSGAGWAVNQPVRQAMVANVVPKEALMNATALSSMAFNINRVFGPALGGLLIAFFGPATNFFIQAVCYMGVALMVLPINIQREERTEAQRAPVFTNLVEGLRYVAKEQTTLALILMAAIPALFIMPFVNGLMPVFSEEVLDGGPEGLGLLLSAVGLGGLLGALALASFRDVRHRGVLLLGGATLQGLLVIAFSRTTWLPIALVSLVAVGASHMAYMTTNNTILQTITPDKLRGRVMSLYMLDHGLVPLGGLMAGSLARFYGSPNAILVGGIISVILIIFVGIKFRAIRHADELMPRPEEAVR